jgi:hypothetical protein
MTDTRSWGSTVLGWFIVREDAAGQSDGESAPAGGESPSAAEAAPAASMPEVFQAEPPPAPGGQVDFAAVFAAAGIAADERDRVDKAAVLLAGLPSDTPVAIRKQIVEASMKAFGVPIDRIIETGVQEIQALEGYIRRGAAETEQLLGESRARIAQFEREIQNIRTVMDMRVSEQGSVTAACNARKLDVQRVLEFFGQEAVARVVRDSPKLHDPSAPPAASGQA